MDKRTFLRATTVVALCGKNAAAIAQQKVVKIVVPFAAGGASDQLARLLADRLGGLIKSSVIVENRPGAGGNIAGAYVARSPADGQTLFIGSQAQLAVAATLYRGKLPYDPEKDFAPVILATKFACIVVVREASPIKSFPDLLKYLKENKARSSYASAGVGSIQHIGGEMLRQLTGVTPTHVPYKGGEPAVVGLVGGDTTFMMALLTDCMSLVKAGRLRALAVTTPNRLPDMPDIPAVSEFVPDFHLTGWYGLTVPAKTPLSTVMRLNSALNEILSRPKVRKQLQDNYLEPAGGPPQLLAETMEKDTKELAKVILNGHMQVN